MCLNSKRSLNVYMCLCVVYAELLNAATAVVVLNCQSSCISFSVIAHLALLAVTCHQLVLLANHAPAAAVKLALFVGKRHFRTCRYKMMSYCIMLLLSACDRSHNHRQWYTLDCTSAVA
eukprot:2348-Heterococcus_DN1.PRE.1